MPRKTIAMGTIAGAIMPIIIATRTNAAARKYGFAGRIITRISLTIGPSPAMVRMAASLRTRNTQAIAPIAKMAENVRLLCSVRAEEPVETFTQRRSASRRVRSVRCCDSARLAIRCRTR
jgi:hypothetical protein